MAVQNTCSCLDLPGSYVSCSPHQIAICRFDGVNCHHECRDSTAVADILLVLRAARSGRSDPIQRLETTRAIKALAANVTGDMSLQMLPIESIVESLSAGSFADPETGQLTTFTLPKEMARALKDARIRLRF